AAEDARESVRAGVVDVKSSGSAAVGDGASTDSAVRQADNRLNKASQVVGAGAVDRQGPGARERAVYAVLERAGADGGTARVRAHGRKGPGAGASLRYRGSVGPAIVDDGTLDRTVAGALQGQGLDPRPGCGKRAGKDQGAGPAGVNGAAAGGAGQV